MNDAITAAMNDDLGWAESMGVELSPRLVERFTPAPTGKIEDFVLDHSAGASEANVRRAALQVARERLGDDNVETLEQWALLLAALHGCTDAEGRVERARRAVGLMEEVKGASDAQFVGWTALAAALAETNPTEAAVWYRRAIDTAANDASFPEATVELSLRAAQVVAGTGDAAWALRTLEYARGVFVEYGGTTDDRDHLETGEAMVLAAAGRTEEALRAMTRARKSFRAKQGPWAPASCRAVYSEVKLLMVLGRADEGRRLVEPLVNEIGKDKRAPASSSALLRFTLGLALGQLGKVKEALGLIESAVHRLKGDDAFTAEVAAYLDEWMQLNRAPAEPMVLHRAGPDPV